MPAPRNPDAERMYGRYLDGLSLGAVAAEFGCSRQTVYDMFRRRGLALRSRPAPQPFVVFRGERYTVGDHGYYRKTRGDRSLLHRDVWEAHHGSIPDWHDIHHRDRDKTNNRVENLECLRKDEHARRFSTGNNQFSQREAA